MKPHFCHVLLNFVWTPKEFHKIGCTCSSSLRLCVCVCVLLCFQHQDNANFVDQVGWNDLSLSLLWSCLRSNAFHDTVQLVGKIRHWLHWSWVVLVGRDCITLYILSMYWSLYMFCNILNLSLHPRYSSRKAADKNVCLITSSINVGLCFVTWEVSFRIVNTLEYQFAFCPRGCGGGAWFLLVSSVSVISTTSLLSEWFRPRICQSCLSFQMASSSFLWSLFQPLHVCLLPALLCQGRRFTRTSPLNTCKCSRNTNNMNLWGTSAGHPGKTRGIWCESGMSTSRTGKHS